MPLIYAHYYEAPPTCHLYMLSMDINMRDPLHAKYPQCELLNLSITMRDPIHAGYLQYELFILVLL